MKTKSPEESVVVQFDFSSELPSVTSAVVSVQIHGVGADPALSSFIQLAPQIVGASVLQRISGGVLGVRYRIQCIATKGADIIKRRGIIHVSDE